MIRSPVAVHVARFAIDVRPITKVEFRRFFAATGDVSAAEIVPLGAEFPEAAPTQARSGVAGARAHRRPGATG